MKFKPVNLIAAIGALALVLGMHSAAQAGFVAATVDSETATSLLSSGAGGAPAESEPAGKPSKVHPIYLEHPALFGGPGSSAGMSSQTVQDAPGSSTPALANGHPAATAPAPLARLVEEGNLSLPPPLAERLFRPPRS